MVFLEMRDCGQHSVSRASVSQCVTVPGLDPAPTSLVTVWDSQLLLTYGAGYSILANVVVQEHLK